MTEQEVREIIKNKMLHKFSIHELREACNSGPGSLHSLMTKLTYLVWERSTGKSHEPIYIKKLTFPKEFKALSKTSGSFYG